MWIVLAAIIQSLSQAVIIYPQSSCLAIEAMQPMVVDVSDRSVCSAALRSCEPVHSVRLRGYQFVSAPLLASAPPVLEIRDPAYVHWTRFVGGPVRPCAPWTTFHVGSGNAVINNVYYIC